MGVGVDEAKLVVEKGELATSVVGHVGCSNDGCRGGHGGYCLDEALARDVEHVDRDVQASERCDALCRRYRLAVSHALVQRLPIVVLEIPPGSHSQLKHMAICTLCKSFSQLRNSHPPLRHIQLFVELFCVISGQRWGSTGRSAVFTRPATRTSLEGGGEGANDIETEGAGQESCAGEWEPCCAP